MKKITIIIAALLPAINAFAYNNDNLAHYGYNAVHSDEMAGFGLISIVLMAASVILSVVILVRWWKMTANIEQIRKSVTKTDINLTYLIAIGDRKEAEKVALKSLFDTLYPIYSNPYDHFKAQSMDSAIIPLLREIKKLDLTVPDYVTSGEKFIDHINALTKGKVAYEESN